ncbi:MAG: OmpH family outer membrane protein [Gammaproteobacteria bacterium]|nr:MAG: OmpH family outer membrane protein [Gammaproteobacteria bacterium]
MFSKIRFVIISFILAMSTFSGPAFAEIKIGVVVIDRLLQEAPQAVAAQKRLQSEFSSRDKKLLAEQKKTKKLEDKLQRDGAVMSEAERIKTERNIRNRRRDFRRKAEELREDRAIRANQELTKLQKLVNQAIREVGKSEKFTVILYDGIAYANKGINITEKILERMKKQASKAKK